MFSDNDALEADSPPLAMWSKCESVFADAHSECGISIEGLSATIDVFWNCALVESLQKDNKALNNQLNACKTQAACRNNESDAEWQKGVCFSNIGDKREKKAKLQPKSLMNLGLDVMV